MKRITAAISFFLFALPVWTQDVFNHPLRQQDMDAFKTICASLSEHSIVRGNFEQEKILSRLNRSLKSSGNFIIAGDLGMVWETLKPFPSALSLGKDYIIQSRAGGQKTVLSAQGNETFVRLADVISAVFSGNAQRLLDNFQVYYSGSPGAWELGLLPLDKAIASCADRITMTGDAVIKSIIINEQNGDSITYRLSNHNYPPELSTNEKTFFSFP